MPIAISNAQSDLILCGWVHHYAFQMKMNT